MSLHQPFLFERKLLPKVWGGRKLQRMLGLALPADVAVGESWELYDRRDGASRLRGSERTLHDLLRDDPQGLLGAAVAAERPERFPLLLKFIDAQQALSVQVHPDDALARAENDMGKDEAWVVLDAGPQARICRGVRAGVSAAQFAAAASTAAVERLLWSFQPQVGDCVDVPAGTVHAIGPDVVVFEVQQNSDVTYRLYDWGRDREVHLHKALAAAHLDVAAPDGDRPVIAPRALADGGELLVASPHFRLRRYVVNGAQVLPTNQMFATLTVIAGEGLLRWRGTEQQTSMPIVLGDTALVPAALGEVVVEASAPLVVLVCDPGVQ